MIVGYFRGSFGISHCCRHDTGLTGCIVSSHVVWLIHLMNGCVCQWVGVVVGWEGGGSECGWLDTLFLLLIQSNQIRFDKLLLFQSREIWFDTLFV